jgi:hypothetical protein
MLCDQAQSLLFDYVDDHLPDQVRLDVGDHIETCTDCQADYQGILALQSQASLWHDLPAPQWQPPAMPGKSIFEAFQQWFPSLASAAALIAVAVLYIGQPSTDVTGTVPTPVSFPADSAGGNNFPPAGLPVVYTGDNGLETIMLDNRMQRQEELQALVRLLRSEMDRRSEETEESLRYVIAHQIQGQREINDLYDRLLQINYERSANGSRSRSGNGEQM